MLTKITLVVALCSGMKFGDVQKQLLKMQSDNPGVQVSVRVDKKAVCYNGTILTGKDAKLLKTLEGKE